MQKVGICNNKGRGGRKDNLYLSGRSPGSEDPLIPVFHESQMVRRLVRISRGSKGKAIWHSRLTRTTDTFLPQ
jgi:hypothetical protein